MQTQTTEQRSSLNRAISRTNGNPELSAAWLSEHRGDVTLIDVREPHELSGPLGAVDGATNVPLTTLLERGLDVPTDQPIVLLCRSGRRSSVAVQALEERGYEAVASVEGGMLAWNAQVLGRASIYEDEKHENAANLMDAIDRTNGLPEVSATWVRKNLGRFTLVDVRERAERAGPMGFIAQAEHVPLARVMVAARDWPRDQPIVIHCASGGRSGRAAMALEAAGFTRVASMEGGMIAWRSHAQT